MPSTCERCGATSLPLRKKCPTCKGSKRVYTISVQDSTHSRTTYVNLGETRFGDILRQFGTTVGRSYCELYDENNRRLDLNAVVTEAWLDAHNGHLHVLSQDDQINGCISSLAREIREGRLL